MEPERGSGLYALMAAIPSEGDLLLSHLRVDEIVCCGGMEIRRGILAEREVLVAFSGLGKSNAAAAVAALLAKFRVSRLWMWGSAGAYHRAGVELTRVALASEEILGDEGVVTLSSWQSLNAIGIPLARADHGPIFNRIPVDQAEFERARDLLSRRQTLSPSSQIHLGPFITVSGVSGSPARARLLGERFGGLCENMEGAAAALVCLNHGVPFLEIRGLSNWSGDRRNRRWRLTEALNNCQRALLYLLETWDQV